MKGPSIVNRLLHDAYVRNGSRHVAFLDETFRSGRDFPGEKPFYLMTAVLVSPQDFDVLREELEDIAGGNYWHSTEELSTEEGRQRVEEMLEYLSRGDELSIVSHYRDEFALNADIEEMRKVTFHSLCGRIFQENPGWSRVNLAVLERRNGNNLFEIDERNFKAMRKSGIVPPQGRLFQASPAEENLLWLPDLVSTAIRQEIVRNNSSYVDLIRHHVRIFDVK